MFFNAVTTSFVNNQHKPRFHTNVARKHTNMFRSILLFVALSTTAVLAAYAPDRIASLPSAPTLPSAQYSGYIPLAGNRQAFYWFAESQANPTKDPLVVWFNGGPGCTSL